MIFKSKIDPGKDKGSEDVCILLSEQQVTYSRINAQGGGKGTVKLVWGNWGTVCKELEKVPKLSLCSLWGIPWCGHSELSVSDLVSVIVLHSPGLLPHILCFPLAVSDTAFCLLLMCAAAPPSAEELDSFPGIL